MNYDNYTKEQLRLARSHVADYYLNLAVIMLDDGSGFSDPDEHLQQHIDETMEFVGGITAGDYDDDVEVTNHITFYLEGLANDYR